MLQKKGQLSHSPLEAPSARSSASRLSSLEARKIKGTALEGSLDVTGEMLNQHISQQLFVGDIGPERKTSNLRRLRWVQDVVGLFKKLNSCKNWVNNCSL